MHPNTTSKNALIHVKFAQESLNVLNLVIAGIRDTYAAAPQQVMVALTCLCLCGSSLVVSRLKFNVHFWTTAVARKSPSNGALYKEQGKTPFPRYSRSFKFVLRTRLGVLRVSLYGDITGVRIINRYKKTGARTPVFRVLRC